MLFNRFSNAIDSINNAGKNAKPEAGHIRKNTKIEGYGEMIAVDNNVLTEMVNAIVREINPEQVIVFGSHARGDAKTDSDVDLLIIEREPFGNGRSRRKEIARIRKILSGFRIPKDILVYSIEELNKWKHSINHVISYSLREGKLFYEKRY